MEADYAQGNKLARENALSHLKTAEFLTEQSSAGYAMTHSILASEEAAKAVYCGLVGVGAIDPSAASPVFRAHPPKAILFSQIFESSLQITRSREGFQVSVDGDEFVPAMVGALTSNESSLLARHGLLRNQGVYVDLKGGDWYSPQGIPLREAEEVVGEFRQKAIALIAISQLISEEGLDRISKIGNFRVDEVDYRKETLTIRWDEI